MFTWSIFSFLGLVSRARLLSLEGRRRVLFPDTGITRAGLAVSRENSINQFIYRKEILVLAKQRQRVKILSFSEKFISNTFRLKPNQNKTCIFEFQSLFLLLVLLARVRERSLTT